MLSIGLLDARHLTGSFAAARLVAGSFAIAPGAGGRVRASRSSSPPAPPGHLALAGAAAALLAALRAGTITRAATPVPMSAAA
jgi:hypothetical protein